MTREEAVEVYHGLINEKIKEAFEFFAPELAESEDERIRKWIIEKVQGYADSGIPCSDEIQMANKALAYLEKQKEQKPMNNPKWNELTWQDINELEEIINHVHYEFRNGISAEGFGKEVLEQFRNMKEDAEVDACEQKPAEWSEEDEDAITTAIRACKYITENFENSTKQYEDAIERLKSLRPQPHWKPSEEQMVLLRKVYSLIWADQATSADIQDGLGDFIEQLKTL